MDAKTFGNFISQCRKEKNLTQDELGRKLSVTGKAVSRWERGLGFPDISTLEPLSNALGVSLMELMKAQKGLPEEPASDAEMLNETITYLKFQRRQARIKCIVLALLSFVTMIMGIVISTLYIDNLPLRAAFVALLICTSSWSSSTLRGLFKI